MPFESQMQKGPHLAVAPEDYMAAPASVASVGPALRDEFLPPQMSGTRTSVA